MWTLARVLVVVIALTGFAGQAGAFANPTHSPDHVAAAMVDCSDHTGMIDRDSPAPSQQDPDSSPACMAKLGCAAPLAVLPAAVRAPVPVATSVRLRSDPHKNPDEAQGPRILRPPTGRG